LVCRSGDGQKFIRDRRRYRCTRHQRLFAGRLHDRMPLPAASDRGISRSTRKIAGLLSRLRLRELSESPPHALGVGKSVLGRLYRSLCAALRHGNLARFQNRVSDEARCVEADQMTRERMLQRFNPLNDFHA
jgi:hypothetical protein